MIIKCDSIFDISKTNNMNAATSHEIQLNRQAKFHSLLENYGITYAPSIGSASSEAYTKNNSSFGISTILSYDVDLEGVFEDEEKISGMVIINSKQDNGFKTASYPVIVVTFNK